MMMVHLGTAHVHRGGSRWGRQASGIGDTRRTGSAWARHVASMGRGLGLAGSHLGHATDATTPQSWVLVAVSPAVYGALNEATLAAQAWVQLGEGPTDGVTLGLVVQTIALVLVLGTASARVDAILRLEVLGQFFDIDRLDVATDGVLHLDAIARVLKGNPLDAVLVLANDEGRGGRNGAWRCVRIAAGASWRASVHGGRTDGRTLGRRLGRTQSRGRPLQRGLRQARLGTSRHAGRGRMLGMLSVVLLLLLVRMLLVRVLLVWVLHVLVLLVREE